MGICVGSGNAPGGGGEVAGGEVVRGKATEEIEGLEEEEDEAEEEDEDIEEGGGEGGEFAERERFPLATEGEGVEEEGVGIDDAEEVLTTGGRAEEF